MCSGCGRVLCTSCAGRGRVSRRVRLTSSFLSAAVHDSLLGLSQFDVSVKLASRFSARFSFGSSPEGGSIAPKETRSTPGLNLCVRPAEALRHVPRQRDEEGTRQPQEGLVHQNLHFLPRQRKEEVRGRRRAHSAEICVCGESDHVHRQEVAALVFLVQLCSTHRKLTGGIVSHCCHLVASSIKKALKLYLRRPRHCETGL